MTVTSYDSYHYDLAKGNLGDLSAATLKVALLTSSYTPSRTTHTRFSDLTNEVTGSGYTAGGWTLSGVALTLDTTNHLAKLDADDVNQDPTTIAATRYGVIYKSTGTGSTSPLICYIDFGSDQSSSAGPFKIIWPANGIIQFKQG